VTRYTRFAGVGVMGFAIQLATLTVLTAWFRVPHVVALCLAVEAAILHNFLWHERWTWRDRTADTTLRARVERFVRFNAASGAVSLTGNVILTMIVISITHAPVPVANVAAVLCLTLLNYRIADRVTFRVASAASATRPRARGLRMRVARSFFMCAAAAIVGLAMPATTQAAEPSSATLEAWNRYVARVEATLARETHDPHGFLSADFTSAGAADVIARLQRGEIVVENLPSGAIDGGAGTISHWRGYVMVPGARVQDLIDHAALRGRFADLRQEDVLDWRVLGRDADSLRLFLKLQRRAIVTVAYNTEHLVSYERLDSDRATSRSVSTKIAELRDAGTARETEKAAGEDRGFLWRLHSYWRYRSAPGGVIVQLDSLTLSRDIPWALRVMAGPVVERIARDSLQRTLAALRAGFAGSRAN